MRCCLRGLPDTVKTFLPNDVANDAPPMGSSCSATRLQKRLQGDTPSPPHVPPLAKQAPDVKPQRCPKL